MNLRIVYVRKIGSELHNDPDQAQHHPSEDTVQEQQRKEQPVEYRQPQPGKFPRRAPDLLDGHPAEKRRAKRCSDTQQRQQ